MSLLKKAERYARKLEKASLSRRSRVLQPETREQSQEEHPEIPASDGAAIRIAVEKRLLRRQGLTEISLGTGAIIPGVSETDSTGNRVATGIPGFDKEINGGFIEKSVNLLTGSAGSGKTVFAIQFLMHGIEKGEPGLYISFEERKENFYKYMSQFGWNLQDLEDKGEFAFIRFTPEKASNILSEGNVESVVKRQGIKRICIDSLSAFTVLSKDSLAARDSLLNLLELVKKWGATTIVTGEQAQSKSESSVLEFDPDSVVSLVTLRTQHVRQRVADIIKMPGVQSKVLPMKISDEGLSFYELL